MSLDYHLSLITPDSPDDVRSALVEKLGLKRVEHKFLVGTAIWISLGTAGPEWKQMIFEGFQFEPDLSLLMELHKNDEAYEQGLRLILQITQFLLERGNGDAVLLFNGELIILQRLHGELLLNADYESWLTGHRLIEEIHLPHTLRSLPSPL